MAHPEQWLKAAIEDASDCAAWPLGVTEGASLPYVCYARTATAREGSLAAPLPTAVPPMATFQVEIYAATYLETKQLADDIRQGLHNFNGTSGGVTILDSSLVDERDGDPVFFDGQDKPVFFVEQTYQVRFEE